uniref:aminotransferase class I/II-fold pyridoxal phosphate-dependent enzyme n=1 Tax=Myxococcus sp. AB025B TaxID=2562794 RepID=UPI0034CFFD0E
MIPLRESFRDIPLYSPPKRPCRVDLSDNTNLFGVPPAAERVLRESRPESLSRYPRGYAPDLRDVLASRLGVGAGCVTTGCGSDDVLDSALRAFLEPGEVLAFQDPTFVMMPLFAKVNGLKTAPCCAKRTCSWRKPPRSTGGTTRTSPPPCRNRRSSCSESPSP